LTGAVAHPGATAPATCRLNMRPRWYHRPAICLLIILKRLQDLRVCHAGMTLAKTAGCVLYSTWVSGRPSQWDHGRRRRCL